MVRLRAILAMAVVPVLVVCLWRAGRVVWAAGELEATIPTLRVLARSADELTAEALVVRNPATTRAAAALLVLRDELVPLRPVLATTARLSDQLRWVEDLPDALLLASPLARLASAVSQDRWEEVDGEAGTGSLGRMASAVDGDRILAELVEADAALERLRDRNLAGPLQALSPLVSGGAVQGQAALDGARLLAAVGMVLQAEGAQSHLVVLQNEKELRATGGFIGSVGRITLDHGAVRGIEWGSSYAVDEHVRPPPPPPAYARYLGLGGWYLRDANWWPDWPTSAAQIELAWSRAGYGPLDGVIAIDSAAVGRLLRAVGPVRVPEYGVVSANNFERLAAEQLYTGEATARAGGFHRARAAFLGPIGRALADSVDELSPSQLRAALLETVRLLDEKHVQLALKDGRLSRLAYARGWDGRITRGASDGALVIDTTVSYGDTYAFVRSSVRDEIEVGADGRVLHNLTLTYRNQYPDGLPTWMPSAMVEGTIYQIANGTFHSQSGLWGGWVRAYLPESASEVSVAGLEDTAPVRSELGKLVVTGFLRLEPGQVRTATIRYQYQRELRGDSLLIPVQKQAGLHCRHTHILVNWSDGKHDSYDGCPSRDGVIEFRRGE